MKKVIFFILLGLFFIFSTNVSAEQIKASTKNNIKKAILIEKYIKNHKINIDKIISKYNIENDFIINQNLKELDKSILILQKIQKIDISKKDSDKVIKSVLLKIKNINKNLKLRFKSEKKKFELKIKKKKEVYTKLGLKFSKKIDYINIQIAKKILKNNNSLSSNQLNIKKSLIKLSNENQKLKNIGNINFDSEEEIRNYFINILNNIKTEINFIKQNLKKD